MDDAEGAKKKKKKKKNIGIRIVVLLDAYYLRIFFFLCY